MRIAKVEVSRVNEVGLSNTLDMTHGAKLIIVLPIME